MIIISSVVKMKTLLTSISTILLSLFLSKGVTESKINIVGLKFDENIDNNFTPIIVRICDKLVKNNRVVTIVIPVNESDLMAQVTENLFNDLAKTWSVKSIDGYIYDYIEQWAYPGSERFLSTKVHVLSDIYIIPLSPLRNLDHFESQLMYLERDYSFNHKATFILLQVLGECARQSSEQIIKILNIMWSTNLFASIMVTFYKCSGTFSVISAKPFSPENVCRQVHHYDVNYFKLSTYVDELKLLDLSYGTPKTFNNCLFWAGTVPAPPYVLRNRVIKEDGIHYEYNAGMDIEFMRLASEKLNFTYDFYKTLSLLPSAWFIQLANKTVIGILQDIMEKRIDVAFGGVVPSYITYYKYDYTPTYKFSAICWYIPSANPVNPWKVLFLVYPLNVWLLSASTFVVVFVVYSIMSNSFAVTNPFYLIKKSCGKIILDLFSIGLGISSSLCPKPVYLRILLVSWIIYSMNWTIIYQTMLFTLLAHPPMEKEMNTLQDLEDSKLKVSTASLYIDFFRFFESNNSTKSILSNYVICDDVSACIQDFTHYRNFSIMEKIETVDYLLNMKTSKIHRLDEHVVSYSVSFLFNKGNPLTKEFSKVLLRTFQAGFLQKWELDVGWEYHELPQKGIPSENDSIPLNIQDLVGALSLLALGLCISLLVLIGEVLFSKFSKHSA